MSNPAVETHTSILSSPSLSHGHTQTQTFTDTRVSADTSGSHTYGCVQTHELGLTSRCTTTQMYRDTHKCLNPKTPEQDPHVPLPSLISVL